MARQPTHLRRCAPRRFFGVLLCLSVGLATGARADGGERNAGAPANWTERVHTLKPTALLQRPLIPSPFTADRQRARDAQPELHVDPETASRVVLAVPGDLLRYIPLPGWPDTDVLEADASARESLVAGNWEYHRASLLSRGATVEELALDSRDPAAHVHAWERASRRLYSEGNEALFRSLFRRLAVERARTGKPAPMLAVAAGTSAAPASWGELRHRPELRTPLLPTEKFAAPDGDLPLPASVRRRLSLAVPGDPSRLSPYAGWSFGFPSTGEPAALEKRLAASWLYFQRLLDLAGARPEELQLDAASPTPHLDAFHRSADRLHSEENERVLGAAIADSGAPTPVFDPAAKYPHRDWVRAHPAEAAAPLERGSCRRVERAIALLGRLVGVDGLAGSSGNDRCAEATALLADPSLQSAVGSRVRGAMSCASGRREPADPDLKRERAAWAAISARHRRARDLLFATLRPGFRDCGLTPTEVAAVAGYTGDDYGSLNVAAAGPGGPYVETLNAALAKLGDYRGVVRHANTFASATVARLDAGAASAAAGDASPVISFASYVSATTLDHYVFTAPHRLRIESRHGRYIAPLSGSPDEEEVLFPPGTRFEVRGRTTLPDGSPEWVLREVE